ncbi:MAG: BAAT/acyl-CoA thioester hydrolase, partial [uncultured bacterium]
PHWPLGAYILCYVQRVIGHRFDDIAPGNTIARVGCPVLIAHGEADETVPVSEAREIYAARRSELVELLLIPGSHDNYGDIGQQMAAVCDFLQRSFGLDDARTQPAKPATTCASKK